MIVEVDVASAVPPYEQLRSQIVDLVAVGSLPVGARLPPIRQLAGDLGLAPGTVARAYAVAVRSLASSRDEAIAALDRELGALPPSP